MEEIGYSEIIAILALIIAGIEFVVIMRDRRPRLRVKAEGKLHKDLDEELGEIPIGEEMLITITNLSSRRIFVNSVFAEWRGQSLLPSRRYKVQIPLPMWFGGDDEYLSDSHFWIEPWGSEVLIGDPNMLEREISRNIYGTIWYCIAVEDGLGKAYRSRSWKIKGELKTKPKPEPEPEKW